MRTAAEESGPQDFKFSSTLSKPNEQEYRQNDLVRENRPD